MSIFGFRTRSADRDRDTDERRLKTLSAAFDDLSEEIRKERDGLKGRYDRVRDNAAFALQALDDGGTSRVSAKVDELTRSLAHCEARLAALDEHARFIDGVRQQVKSYFEGLDQGS